MINDIFKASFISFFLNLFIASEVRNVINPPNIKIDIVIINVEAVLRSIPY